MSIKLEIGNKRLNQVLFYGGLVGLAISMIAMAIDMKAFGQVTFDEQMKASQGNAEVWTELKKQAEPLRIALSEAINCFPDTKCDLIFAGHGFIQVSYADGYEDSYKENFIGMGQAQDIVNNFVKTYGFLDRDYLNINIGYDEDNQNANDNKNNDNDNKNSASNDNDDNDSKDDNDNNDNEYPECDGSTNSGICHDSSDEGPAEGTTTQDNDNVKDSDNEVNEETEDNEDNDNTDNEQDEVEQSDNEESDNQEVSEEQ